MTGFRSTRTDAALYRLLQYTVVRGILVTVIQIILVALYLSQFERNNWVVLQNAISKIYVITMLAMLNSRSYGSHGPSTGVSSELVFASTLSGAVMEECDTDQTVTVVSVNTTTGGSGSEELQQETARTA
ncbi:hypothetical protein V5O48_010110 [Marasmius crinis-equi]|uniref:DUF6534 domain-containing protein n=1 Tax=Marasmius crinis-equi TaxID=585013 RepID=A0ABR3F979_9AGAR